MYIHTYFSCSDVCVKHSVTTARYGLFAWPEVFVGQRVRVRCPFSFSQPVYLQRDCAVSTSTQQVTWAQPLYSTCPGPPLAQLLDKLDEEVLFWMGYVFPFLPLVLYDNIKTSLL